MTPVLALVLAPAGRGDAGPLERVLDAAWSVLAERHRAGFLEAGATEAVVRREPPDDTPFGARLRRILAELQPPGGLIVLGAGAIPLASPADRRAFVAAAASQRIGALANQRYSADIVAIARAAETLRELPDIPTDNALPRWLAESAGVPVSDLRERRRLAMDADSPLDLVLIDGARGIEPLPLPDERDAERVRASLAALRSLATDPGAEILVAGRTSAADLRWLERNTQSRTRALIEERGLRTAPGEERAGRMNRRAPHSLLGALLDRDGWGSLGHHLEMLADGALLDSRVLLAHRLGASERAWPSAEDRFASDLLLPERVADPWLRALTQAAVDSPVPVLLGGHSLVGPGVRLALGSAWRRRGG